MSRGPNQSGSIMLIEEYFDAQDDRFLTALREFQDWKPLGAFAQNGAPAFHQAGLPSAKIQFQRGPEVLVLSDSPLHQRSM